MGFFKGKFEKKSGGVKDTLSDFFGFSRGLVKREVVKPYMNPIDSSILYDGIKPKIMEQVVAYGKAKGKQVNVQKLDQFLSKHLLNDVFSLYYNDKFELEKKRDNNKVKYKIIENVNDYLSKVITNNSAISSYVFTQEIGTYLGKLFVTELTEEQQKKMCEEMDNCNGDGEEEDDGKPKKPSNGSGTGKMEKEIEHGLNNTRKEFEQALKDAQQKIKDLEKNTDLTENQKNKDHVNRQMTEDVGNATGNMHKIKSEVEMLNVNKHALEKAVNRILDKSTGHFSSKYKTYDEDLLDAQEVMDIDGLEYIHPIFQKTMVPELTTSERKYFGKFDLYIDHSGSMGSSCGLNTSHGQVSRTLLAKAIALRMKRMGILNNLYLFDDSVNQIKNTELNILLIGSGGGTRIENVLSNVRKTGKNSVVLTDGDDHISTYLHNAYFVGVSVGTFHNFHGGDAKKYLQFQQCCIFDGQKVQVPCEKDWK
jgi:hypothetical protein